MKINAIVCIPASFYRIEHRSHNKNNEKRENAWRIFKQMQLAVILLQ
jgi:hypothetical protein